MPAAIDHVVVLMLENRSFDSMLGWLRPGDPTFRGLVGDESNPGAGEAVRVWNRPGIDAKTMCIPDPDPGERFAEDISVQLFGAGQPMTGTPSMDGFVASYLAQPGVTASNADGVMHYFTPAQVPALSRLALAFGVSDSWHASAPCQTWPNRFFVHTATAGGHVNNMPLHFPYRMKSIFELLDEASKTWRIYFHDIPQSATLANVWEAGPTNFRLFEAEFIADARAGTLPNYSFIEPRYFSNALLGLIPNDQHPPHNVQYGDDLIATIYNALRGGPGWPRTLFIVTYDEHGGLYDHVPPPPAPPPGGPAPDGFAFDRYGVRVPAVIVSPFIPPGTIVRPDAGSPNPFDHTSIIATLRKLWNLGGPLTGRDAAAPDLLGALSLPEPANDGPDSVTSPGTAPTAAEVANAVRAAPNDHQKSLSVLAAHLPAAAAVTTGQAAALERQVIAPALETVEAAAGFVEARVRAFLGEA